MADTERACSGAIGRMADGVLVGHRLEVGVMAVSIEGATIAIGLTKAFFGYAESKANKSEQGDSHEQHF